MISEGQYWRSISQVGWLDVEFITRHPSSLTVEYGKKQFHFTALLVSFYCATVGYLVSLYYSCLWIKGSLDAAHKCFNSVFLLSPNCQISLFSFTLKSLKDDDRQFTRDGECRAFPQFIFHLTETNAQRS